MLKKNQEINLDIEQYGYEGEGIGKYNGIPIFVPYAAVGDRLIVKILKVAKTHAFGKIIEILKPSQDRQDVNCPAYLKCGGCSLLHITYEQQLKLKKQRVQDCMRKIAKIDVEVNNTVPSPNILMYRNKVQVPIGLENSEIISGFYANHSHRIAKNDGCLLQDKCMQNFIDIVKLWMKNYNIPPYDEINHNGTIRHIYLRHGKTTNETMVVIVSTTAKIPHIEFLVEALKTGNATTVVINVNHSKTNVILGNKYSTLYGKGYIEDTLCGNTYKISPESFYQVNHSQTENLYKIAIEQADIKSTDTVFDLYCGIGTISIYAAKYAKKVIGVEIVETAVQNAKENAKLNNLNAENIDFICGQADKVCEDLIKSKIKPDIVIIDPPRKGADEGLIDLLTKLAPKKILYISCNPATLARDLAKIMECNPYKISPITPVDMFPMTHHVECVVLMSRQNLENTVLLSDIYIASST
jgi:23S rRNA (uracil1939-C5)-methyltransferase